MQVLITTPNFGAQSREPWEVFERAGIEVRRPQTAHPLSAAALAADLVGVDAAVIGLDDVASSVFAASSSLKVVAKHGVGTDNIDLAAAKVAGVRVVNAPGSNSGAVADLTMSLVLASARRIVPAHQSTAAGEWERFPGMELEGRTLALVGFGRIGQAVARRAQAFGMRVAAYDPYLPAEVFGELDVRRVELLEAVEQADVLSLHMPGSVDGRPLLDGPTLARMRRGAHLVNAARGDLIDEHALAELLRSGHLAGAALDALAIEPLPAASPLHGAPNLILTPHIGAQSDRANVNMGVMVAEDVVRVLTGETPRNAVV